MSINFKVFILGIILSLTSTLMSYAAEPTREVHTINDGWQIFPLSATDGADAEYISIPHSWQCDAGEYGSGTSSVNYIKTLNVPLSWADKRLFLRFGGVQNVADLFVNGRYVGTHKGGFTAFTFEITSNVKFGTDNYLRVVVSNDRRNDMFPLSSDMDLMGGMFRDVELMVTPKNILSPLHHSTDGVYVVQQSVSAQRVEGVVRCYVSATTVDNASIAMRMVGPDGYEVDHRVVRVTKLPHDRAVDIPFEILQPVLWSPDLPNMYRVEVTLNDGSNDDMVVVNTGFRKITVTDDNKLCINGVLCDVKGVNYAHDRKGYGMAITIPQLESDFNAICDLGANAVRSLSGPHRSEFYDWCDQRGLLSWIDLPFTRSSIAFSDICYYPSPELMSSGREQLEDIIYQNFNHPSVVMWGLFSLVWQPGEDIEAYVRELNDVAHTIDPSRLTVACSNSDGAINLITDLIVLRQDIGLYKGHVDDVAVWCRQLKDPRWADMRYGVCYGEEGSMDHQAEKIERATRGSRHIPMRRQTFMHERYSANIEAEGNFWGVWIDNMFDYASVRRAYHLNQSGLICYDHITPKDAYYLYRAKWNDRDVTLHIPNRRWSERRDTLQFIDIYSSTGTPVVTVAGDTVAVRRVARGHYTADSVVIKGKAEVIAYDSLGKCSDRVELRSVASK